MRCGGVTAGGFAGRRPRAHREALGEPLVVIRRSALNDVLAGALAGGTVVYGVTAEDSS